MKIMKILNNNENNEIIMNKMMKMNEIIIMK